MTMQHKVEMSRDTYDKLCQENAALREALTGAVTAWHNTPSNFEKAEQSWIPLARAALALGKK